jgi:predicted nuclease of restriction endonuclease-like (RecB) superfamily
MSTNALPVPAGFPMLLEEIKARIRLAQTRAMQAVNAELVQVYWDIGRMIDMRQRQEGWGAGVIPRLARELRNELPEIKGFSERNIKSMLAFYRAYPDPSAFVQQPVAQMPGKRISPPSTAKTERTEKGQQAVAQFPDSLLWSIPWGHHVQLMVKVKDLNARLWYMQQTLVGGWSRNVLLTMIQSEAHRRQGAALTNFERLLPPPQSDLARQSLKDPYIFDFLTLEEPFHERELETNLLRHLERFLLELGQGFAFVGRQLHLEVGDSDFYIDLLFYHLKLRSFVVIDLKTGEFKPEYAGKMNFYLSVVDDQLRHESDAPSIGLILCQDRNHIVAEYALRGVSKPIGVSEYELTRALPPRLKSALPSVEEIEAELTVSETLQLTDKVEVEVVRAKKPTRTKSAKPAAKKQPKKGRRK